MKYPRTIALLLPAAAMMALPLAGDVVSDTNNWFAYPVGPSGVPVDLSFLSKDAGGNFVPAGAHGFLVATNGNFIFEDGTPARFWGLNCTAGAALGGPTRAAQLADRFARMGLNVVRLHHLDSWYSPIIDYNHSDGTTQHLSEQSMARLDALIYQFKLRGIYTVLDPWVQRCFKAGDGVADYGHYGERGNFYLHPWVYMDPRMQELVGQTWSQIWNRVNTYTGVAYKDEPAIIITEVINEGMMQRGANHVSRNPWITTFTNGYEVWARLKGQKTNVGMSIISQNYGEANLRYYTDVCHAFYGAMIARLRAIGLRIPINANNWSSWPWEILSQAGYSFMDTHNYYGGDQIGPGSGLGGLWLSHPPGLYGSPFGTFAVHALPGAALTSSEWGNNPPKTYRAAYPLGVAAIAAFQDWDGFTGYAYSQSASPASTLSAYEWEADPVSVASMAAGALVYRRRDVRTAQHTVGFTYLNADLWTLPWQNNRERDLRNTRGFNTMIETHKVLVSLTNTIPAGVATITNFTVGQAFAYQNTSTEVLSDTGELWRDWGRGVGLINTPRTQAAYGNLGIASQAFSTADCTFNISTPYAVVSLSSLLDAPISNSYHWLLTAAARAENYGQAANDTTTSIARTGSSPVMCEPVVGTLSARLGPDSIVMHPVRVNGTRGPAITLAVTNGIATIDLKAEHRTVFYEIMVIPEPAIAGACAMLLAVRGLARRARRMHRQ